MTSPLPPKRRDSVNLANLLRQDRQRLTQIDHGLVGGRFPPARPLKPIWGDGGEDDELDEEISFWNTDRATATVAGKITLRLTFEPLDGSLHIRWNGIDQPPTEWRLDGQVVTFTDPIIRVGDVLTAAYAYLDGEDAITVGSYFDEVMARHPVGFWNFTGAYTDDSGHAYALNHSGTSFAGSLILTEPGGQSLDMTIPPGYTYSGTPVPAIDAIAGQFSVVWAGRSDNVSSHGYGNVIGQIRSSGDHHFRVQHDPATTPREVAVEWHDGTASQTHHLPLDMDMTAPHFWGVSVTATDVLLYVDGTLISQVPKVSAPIAQAAGNYVCVGTNGSTNQQWAGLLDGVALFATGLTDDDHLRLALAAGYQS